MVFLRIAGLLLWAAYSWGMGQTPMDGLNGFGKFVAMSFFLVAPALYLLPTYEAWVKSHPNFIGIALVNVFLGWSLIGWIVALVWAHKRPEPTPTFEAPTPQTSAGREPVGRATKVCPFCAENILAAAIKCKHCGSDLAQPAHV